MLWALSSHEVAKIKLGNDHLGESIVAVSSFYTNYKEITQSCIYNLK